MKEYLIPFILYILVGPIILQITQNEILAYSLKIFLVLVFLLIFRNKYQKRVRFDFLALIIGIIIFLIWIYTEFVYPVNIVFEYFTFFIIIIRLIGSVLVAPIIEELFTRSFLIRFLINPNWKKVPIGKYTLPSFIITVLFFGFSHNRWIPALIAGILLNLLLYKRKDIGACIFAHIIANLLLSIFVIATSSWHFW